VGASLVPKNKKNNYLQGYRALFQSSSSKCREDLAHKVNPMDLLKLVGSIHITPWQWQLRRYN